MSEAVERLLTVTVAEGSEIELSTAAILDYIQVVSKGLEEVDVDFIYRDALDNSYDGISIDDLYTCIFISTKARIELDPAYSYLGARFLNQQCWRDLFVQVAPMEYCDNRKFETETLTDIFKASLQLGFDQKLISSELLEFDVAKLVNEIDFSRDALLNVLAYQTLYDRYFLKNGEVRIEVPQFFFMRVAMGLSINEEYKEERAIEFYHALSSFRFMSSTPTLFNSGTQHPQLSSCYLTTVSDSLYDIYESIQDNALLSKWAGGLGNDWTNVRSLGAHIESTNGKSQGVIPFLKVVNDTAVAVNQGGKRKGAVCVYLESWHLDIEEFLELRKNTGDDRRRCHDMHTANWIPDLFMKRVVSEGTWTLFSPHEVPDLHDLYGKDFEERYEYYEEEAKKGNLNQFKQIEAVILWRKMLSMIFETGHAWITFKDACNIRSPQRHVGQVHSSNLCTEITLNTSEDEIAVCNLGSINLAEHINVEGRKLDSRKLYETINTGVRMLDNVIDINYYPVEAARNSNLKHRPIGLGVMGFQDALYLLKIPYASKEAVDFADECQEAISYYAIQASQALAVERGQYETFEGSLWSRGLFPLDSLVELNESRGAGFSMDINVNSRFKWNALKDSVMMTGLRNSNIMAIAPTATIANICNVTQSIEPTYQNLYVKSNLSGEFTVINPHLVSDLKALDLWDEAMVSDLKYYDGSLENIDRIPDDLKVLYKTSFDIDAHWLIDAASQRQKWIDQAQSLNLYISKPSGKLLSDMYLSAWKKGLKTTYYLRSKGATSTEKSTVESSQLNAVSPTVCSIDEPDCEACQ